MVIVELMLHVISLMSNIKKKKTTLEAHLVTITPSNVHAKF